MGVDYFLVSPYSKAVLECGKSGFWIKELSERHAPVYPRLWDLIVDVDPDIKPYLQQGVGGVWYLDTSLLTDPCVLEEVYEERYGKDLEWFVERVWKWLEKTLGFDDPNLFLANDCGDETWLWTSLDRSKPRPRVREGWSLDSVFTDSQQQYSDRGLTLLLPWEPNKNII